jgi:hypothetical protein
MKKVLILLLILAVAGGAFAQESAVKISGKVNTGLTNDYTVTDGEDWQMGSDKIKAQDFYPYAQDEDVANIWADINIDAEVDENVSVHAKFRLQPGSTDFTGFGWNEGNIYVPYAYGKVTTFNIVDIYGGLVDNGAWATAGDKADDVGEGLGGLIQIRPIEGLNIGFGVYDDTSSTSNIFLDTIFTYGASYTMADTFRAEISGKTEGQMMRAIFAGAEIFAVPNLSLALEVWSDTLSATDSGWTIDEKASYDLGALDIGVTLWQFINHANFGPVDSVVHTRFQSGMSDDDWAALTSDEYALGLKANLWASYELGAFVPKLEIYGGYGGVSDDGMVLLGGPKEKLTVLYLGAKPSVTWNVGTNAQLVGAYDFGWGQGDIDGDKAKVTAHKVYVDFIYSF